MKPISPRIPASMHTHILPHLLHHIQSHDYKGWDPYDGLTSPFIKNCPFYKSAFFRLCIIQFFKRNPINVRQLFLIPRERNPKGIALCASGLINLWNATKEARFLNEAEQLLNWLMLNHSKGYQGIAWGYNFPWQSRLNFKEKNFPTIVTTSFIALSFLDGYEATGTKKYLEIAENSALFLLNDLNVYHENNAICFSYGPADTSRVYNATALGSHLLARLYFHTKNDKYLDYAQRSLQFVVTRQNSDGSWWYGDDPTQKWIDSFHTGYNLIALKKYQEYTADQTFAPALEKAYSFYCNNFFTDAYEPKYFHNKLYPIDIHTCAVAIVTLHEFHEKRILEPLVSWTIDKLWNTKGYFNYQITKQGINTIPYMRWSQAWMLYALSRLSACYSPAFAKLDA